MSSAGKLSSDVNLTLRNAWCKGVGFDGAPLNISRSFLVDVICLDNVED